MGPLDFDVIRLELLMPRNSNRRPIVSNSLAQQNADFTAEGAPAPGQVAGLDRPKKATPAPRQAASRTPAHIPGAHNRAPTGRKP
jgi:hypothetical protein